MAFVNLLTVIYPVGAIYITTSSTSPSSLIGGTWEKIEDAVVRGTSSAVGYIGSDTHTLTIDEMPSHNHLMGRFWHVGTKGNLANGTYYAGEYESYTTAYTGGGSEHSIEQRSYNCFVWRRTA